MASINLGNIDPRLLNVAIEELPSIIAYIRSLFVKRDPTSPLLTDAQAVALLASAYTSSIAIDDAWDAAHPVSPIPNVPGAKAFAGSIVWGT